MQFSLSLGIGNKTFQLLPMIIKRGIEVRHVPKEVEKMKEGKIDPTVFSWVF
jgi:hypothetical protein